MEIDRQNGDDRQNTWEVAQILAVTGETFFRMFAKRSMN
jgi:hypothetical protein